MDWPLPTKEIPQHFHISTLWSHQRPRLCLQGLVREASPTAVRIAGWWDECLQLSANLSEQRAPDSAWHVVSAKRVLTTIIIITIKYWQMAVRSVYANLHACQPWTELHFHKFMATFCGISLINFLHSNGWETASRCFSLCFLVSAVKLSCLLHVFIAHCFLLVFMVSYHLLIFSMGLLAFFLLIFRNYLCIWVVILYWLYGLQIYPPRLKLVFLALLMVSFAEQSFKF